jgi:hypothetical protein
MALIEIACPHCQRRGYVAADRLPGVLQCSGCGIAELIRDGMRIIRAHYDDSVIDTPKLKMPAKPKPIRKSWKRQLTPRVPVPT